MQQVTLVYMDGEWLVKVTKGNLTTTQAIESDGRKALRKAMAAAVGLDAPLTIAPDVALELLAYLSNLD
jgi:hypothetical protein